MNTVDRQLRDELRDALVSFMTGEIRAFEFDDRVTELPWTTDKSAHEISGHLFLIYDDFIDHIISVTPERWNVLRRIVAFLGTELEIRSAQQQPSWPFLDKEEWHTYEHLETACSLPEFDSAVHGRPFRPWWNNIPSPIGFLILFVAIFVMFVVIRSF